MPTTAEPAAALPAAALPTLYGHPLSSYCMKVYIAARVLGVALEQQLYNPGDAQARAAYMALWPVGKMPLLVDAGRRVPEASIIIEYLQCHHAQAGRRLIAADPAQALEARLWDRLFDLYLMTPMQACTADLLRPEGERDAAAVARAHQGLLMAYAMAEQQLADGRRWVAGAEFSLADCAAAPAFFYALCYVPLPAAHPQLAAYLERLMAHPAVAQTLEAARPFFRFFPGRAGLPPLYAEPSTA